MNNNTTNQKEETLAQATGTVKGTAEHGALKTIHREYNKLNGYEAMLHIINRYRFVLYPFIFLSVAGSSYSFYNDFIKAFPMLGDIGNIFIAIFFSVMLEIVRDGSLIAIFNSKMNKPSRLTVIVIFIAVTSYMYSSHLKAINVIEKSAVEYTLAHQDEKEVTATNPKYAVAVEELKGLKSDLKAKKAEKTPELIKNSTSIHTRKREDALKRIASIDKQIEDIKKKISDKNKEIIGYKADNIKNVEDTQKIISNILLATLLLVESLAMLGAVIKFINSDNAKKEIAKHSEIIEEYVEISEQMKQENEELTKNLSNTVKAQSESNQAIMHLVTEDLKQSSKQNIQFIEAIAKNKNEIMAQMNEMLQVMSMMSVPAISSFNQEQPKAQIQEQPKTRQIGFNVTDSKEAMLQALYNNGAIGAGSKLMPKSAIVNTKKRQENQRATNYYKEFEQLGIIENRGLGRNGGYYALTDYQTALKAIS